MGEGFRLPLGSVMPLNYRVCLRTAAGKKIAIPHDGISLLFVNSLMMIT